ncbi:fatty acid metabolism transcriptional regulator FadR [Alteromonadaceae bacterium BrNp21-10]|nr:fatty acid metabolism transcriptional regulator FadR [Alteromonadaceae bacterium BrNp21-10]
MIYKAQSPAGFAEEYIVESIWSGRFPPGTILPAERELSELIGVTRTTLREVLQRLSRDGWLKIQHGKPTKINNFWETCSLNILETLARLDEEGIPELVDNLLAARTSVSAIFIRAAIKHDSDKVLDALNGYRELAEDGAAYAEFDYRMLHDIAMASGNPVYVLLMNGFRGLYSRIGGYYFSHEKSRQIANDFYQKLIELTQKGDVEAVPLLLRNYGFEGAQIWKELRETMPQGLVD